ncbi:ABC transporter ATP-binding protein [Cumulibacter soli]|uniref:ABC transporter ATP-binding protein n=1 Tax=Cumulibacter soli TaxID=2546344 RepID=UPI0010688BE1|nr:ABC transporter ATP-binding protein [Cumulibacter soli]
MSASKALDLTDIVTGYGDSTICHGVSLHISSGESVALVGPNGAGKSTLLKAVSGLLTCRRGSVEHNGCNITATSVHRRVAAGLIQVPEGRQVFPEMSVLENLKLGAYARPDGAAERLESVFETFPKLRDRQGQDAQTLSGGEQQMLAIGRGLMGNPSVMMLDEPTLGLAPVIVDDVLECLMGIRRSFETSLLVVEQNAYLTKDLCDRYYVMREGQIVQNGDKLPDDPDELMQAFLGSTS